MTEILRRHAFSITFLALLFAFVFFTGGDDSEIQRFSGLTMGTSYEVQVVDLPDQFTLPELAARVDELLTGLDRETFSTYAPDSELSRFNRANINQPVTVSADMIDVLQLAREISELSAGAFDVTVGPLVNLWGFGPAPRLAPGQLPAQTELDAISERVGYQYLQIDQARLQLSKTRDVYVDLSAIAKGFAVDKLGEYFDSLGISSYFIEIGGELKMKGLKPGGVSWIPAIEAPEDSQSRIYEIFFSHGEELAVAGSGDYRNYFEEGGVRYSHEIDPRTGRPITHNLAAAYVIDTSAARADALATMFMVLGVDEGRALAERTGQAVYFIYKNDTAGFDEFYTAGFEYYLDNN